MSHFKSRRAGLFNFLLFAGRNPVVKTRLLFVLNRRTYYWEIVIRMYPTNPLSTKVKNLPSSENLTALSAKSQTKSNFYCWV
jgi:hypothetical protein